MYILGIPYIYLLLSRIADLELGNTIFREYCVSHGSDLVSGILKFHHHNFIKGMALLAKTHL